jgi:isopentenyl-diphosphate delta-isomerase
VLHVNALQEAIQPEGQRDFSGLITKIGRVAGGLSVPLIVKEVGCGISRQAALALVEQGVRFVDTAGSGGTDWGRIEAARADDAELGEVFADWGIPTPESIRQLRDIEKLTLIGSGGVRNGLDLAKALACGAHIAGIAYPFLAAADHGADRVVQRIRRTIEELKICMFCVGARTIDELRKSELVRVK